MIITEVIGEDEGVKILRRHSNLGVYLHKIGTDEHYESPEDREDSPWSYEETDIPIEEEEVTPSDSTE